MLKSIDSARRQIVYSEGYSVEFLLNLLTYTIVLPNPVEEDRKLSSDRATNVLIYLQNKNMVKPYKLVSIGYSQYRPSSLGIRCLSLASSQGA